MLPKHRPYDCAIDLQSGAQSPSSPIYNLLQKELLAPKVYINKILQKLYLTFQISNRSANILCKEE